MDKFIVIFSKWRNIQSSFKKLLRNLTLNFSNPLYLVLLLHTTKETKMRLQSVPKIVHLKIVNSCRKQFSFEIWSVKCWTYFSIEFLVYLFWGSLFWESTVQLLSIFPYREKVNDLVLVFYAGLANFCHSLLILHKLLGKSLVSPYLGK